jgi:hypothetical protein
MCLAICWMWFFVKSMNLGQLYWNETYGFFEVFYKIFGGMQMVLRARDEKAINDATGSSKMRT